jgi:hypothetical protein
MQLATGYVALDGHVSEQARKNAASIFAEVDAWLESVGEADRE